MQNNHHATRMTNKNFFRAGTLYGRCLLVALVFFLGSCARSPNLYRVRSLGWVADSIEFSVRPIDPALHALPNSVEVNCLSCNLVDSYWNVTLDSVGEGYVYIPEANTIVSARLKMMANRLDTTVVLKERNPKEAEAFYKLAKPLVGRVMLVQLGLLYFDSLQSEAPAEAEPGDELNIFGESTDFYLVQHPLFNRPLYLLKSSAVRLY